MTMGLSCEIAGLRRYRSARRATPTGATRHVLVDPACGRPLTGPVDADSPLAEPLRPFRWGVDARTSGAHRLIRLVRFLATRKSIALVVEHDGATRSRPDR